MRRLCGPAILVLLCFAQPVWAATTWQVDYAKSRLGFIATQTGSEFEGRFRKFDARVVFAPDALDASSFNVLVDVASVDTNSADRDSNLPTPEWFDVERFPTARFETLGFTPVGETRYEAKSRLTIRDVTREVRFPFTFTVEGETARLQAKLTLSRTDYGVGQGEWAAADTVGHEVIVVVDLLLKRAELP